MQQRMMSDIKYLYSEFYLYIPEWGVCIISRVRTCNIFLMWDFCLAYKRRHKSVCTSPTEVHAPVFLCMHDFKVV